jgi:hypothetical protein
VTWQWDIKPAFWVKEGNEGAGTAFTGVVAEPNLGSGFDAGAEHNAFAFYAAGLYSLEKGIEEMNQLDKADLARLSSFSSSTVAPYSFLVACDNHHTPAVSQ